MCMSNGCKLTKKKKILNCKFQIQLNAFLYRTLILSIHTLIGTLY